LLLRTVLLILTALPALLLAAPVATLTVNGAIGPASADYVVRGLARAASDGAQLVVLKIDTPGGLDTSMREIIKAIMNSPVPVAAYVAPGGARAASAGTYILYASHIAAMAPGTNLGAATPVQLGGPEQPLEPSKDSRDKSDGAKSREPAARASAMTHKQVNDAAAYIRGLAQLRGRNVEWGERAVREAVSLSAVEALKLHVVDYVAADLPGLLKQLNGVRIRMTGHERRLQTEGAPVTDYPPDWRVKFLEVITDPSVALILLVIGIYGLIFEFVSPGMGLPGVLGGMCLLLGLYALQLLPVNYAGMALIVLGIGVMAAEVFLPSFGLFGVAGIAAFVTGAVILIDTDRPDFGIPFSLIVALAILSATFIAGIAGMALKTRRRPIESGPDQLIGGLAEVIDVTENSPAEGWARIHGENWRVTGSKPLRRGLKVRVRARRGLTLEVGPAEQRASEQS
jgi:membrane-bound serine protease (ClpP class)